MKIRTRTLLLGYCLAVVFLGFAACAPAPGVAAGLPSIRHQVEQQAWDDGIQAFEEGDYNRAKITFEMLSESAQSSDICRKALYALAAVRLVVAQTSEEFAQAVATYEQWSKLVSSGIEGEDPRMITPFLLRLAPGGQPAAGGVRDALQDPSRKLSKENGSILNYKGLLQAKEKEVGNLRARLESREREIRRLRHQLDSLEEIHRKYQEKKQEASTP